MSEGGGFGISFAERFFGLLILIVGILSSYFTLTSTQALGNFAGFFVALGIIVIVFGLLMMTAKTE